MRCKRKNYVQESAYCTLFPECELEYITRLKEINQIIHGFTSHWKPRKHHLIWIGIINEFFCLFCEAIFLAGYRPRRVPGWISGTPYVEAQKEPQDTKILLVVILSLIENTIDLPWQRCNHSPDYLYVSFYLKLFKNAFIRNPSIPFQRNRKVRLILIQSSSA